MLLPQAAQGALGVECRADDGDTARRLAAIDDRRAHREVRAERAFLAELGGGCSLPCGALARVESETGELVLDALLASLDGNVVLRTRVIGSDAVEVGEEAARDLLDGKGGRGLLDIGFVVVTVYLVGAGPGDPGLLTVRGAELLRRADVVVYDRLASPALLELAPPDAELVDVGKAPGRVAMTQEQINELLVARGRAGLEVVRLKGGDPFVFGRGGEEAESCRDANVAFEVVPGITSAIAAPAYAGIPVTHRGLSTSVTIVTGHEDPAKGTHRHRLGCVGARGRHARRAHGRGPRERDRQGVDRRRPGRDNARRSGAMGHAARATHRCARRWRRSISSVSRRRARSSSARSRGSISDGSSSARCSAGAIVVTRAREQASELRSRLEQLGAEVIELPAIALEPVEFSLPALDRYAWLVFTSANGVDAFFDRGLAPVPGSTRARSARFASPPSGPAPLTRSRRAAYAPISFRRDSSRSRLLEAFPDPERPGARVLIARAESARDVLPEGLAERGYEVDVLAVYRTVPVDPDAGRSRRACAPARSTRSRSRRRRR